MEHLLKMSNIRDKVIERVINKIKARSDVGYAKYGVTLHDDEQAKLVLCDQIEECMLKRIEVNEEEEL